MKSAKGLPANRESEQRDALALIDAGFNALATRDGVTLDELNAYQRQREFFASAAAERYRRDYPGAAALSADRSIQFELKAYPDEGNGAEQVETQYYRNEAAARGHAGRWSKRVNGSVDVAHAGPEPWAERYITTASPSPHHAAGYRFERIEN